MHTFASLTTAPTVHSSLVTIVYSIMAMKYYYIYKNVYIYKENKLGIIIRLVYNLEEIIA